MIRLFESTIRSSAATPRLPTSNSFDTTERSQMKRESIIGMAITGVRNLLSVSTFLLPIPSHSPSSKANDAAYQKPFPRSLSPDQDEPDDRRKTSEFCMKTIVSNPRRVELQRLDSTASHCHLTGTDVRELT